MKKNKILRYGLYTLAGLAAAVAATLGYALHRADAKLERQVALSVPAIPLPADAAALERGRHLFASRGCTDCHGATGAGRVVIDDGKGLFVRGPNIAQGAATVANYRVEDWVRAIRHGVKPSGRPALIMPSEDYNRLSDEDLGALIAYLKTLPATEGGPADVRLSLPVKALYGLGLVKDAAEKIDHQRPPSPAMPQTVSIANGAYVAGMCIGCHGPGLSGGKIPGAPPDWPAAANLTPGEGSAMVHYPGAEQFAAMMRSGRRPDGSTVSQVMPFNALKELNDVELQAMYVYLRSLAPRPRGER